MARFAATSRIHRRHDPSGPGRDPLISQWRVGTRQFSDGA